MPLLANAPLACHAVLNVVVSPSDRHTCHMLSRTPECVNGFETLLHNKREPTRMSSGLHCQDIDLTKMRAVPVDSLCRKMLSLEYLLLVGQAGSVVR